MWFPSCFRRIGFQLSREPLGVMRSVVRAPLWGAQSTRLFCFLCLWGHRNLTDDRYRSVARYVSQDALRVERLSFSVSREGLWLWRKTESWDLATPAGVARPIMLPLSVFRAVPLASVGDQGLEGTRDKGRGAWVTASRNFFRRSNESVLASVQGLSRCPCGLPPDRSPII